MYICFDRKKWKFFRFNSFSKKKKKVVSFEKGSIFDYWFSLFVLFLFMKNFCFHVFVNLFLNTSLCSSASISDCVALCNVHHICACKNNYVLCNVCRKCEEGKRPRKSLKLLMTMGK